MEEDSRIRGNDRNETLETATGRIFLPSITVIRSIEKYLYESGCKKDPSLRPE
ncbi:MAG: hypothetical protein NT007_16480 [Candidatus Kapabacteria bacterium]|nr:hypothetical protein [Candidatus Kapabacteria bacterium]